MPRFVFSRIRLNSDRGCQYTSTQLAAAAEELGVRLSVGRTGVGQRSAGELLVHLENRVLPTTSLSDRADAIHAVSSWIDTVYNHRRRHSALGQIAPVAFERRNTTAAAQAA